MTGVNFFTDILPGIVIVIGAPLVIWLYMRRTRGSAPGRLKISDKAALGKNVWVAVVEIDEKRFLVGAGESGVGLLSELEAVPEIVEETADEPLQSTNGITEQPRIGLVRRLQLMTVRSAAESPWRSFGVRRS